MSGDVRRRLADALLALSARRARELGSAELAAPAVVVAPHPDDEVLGCGATIARKRRAGAPVTVAFLTDGRRSHAAFAQARELGARRRAEATQACAQLGIAAGDVVFCEGADGGLDAQRGALADRLEGILRERRPEQLYAPCGWDRWPDHHAAHAVAHVAAARCARAPVVLEYAVWFWDGWPWTAGGPLRTPAAAVRLLAFDRQVTAGADLEVKRAALERHVTQMRRPPGHPDWPILADVRGGELLERWLGPRELLRTAPQAGVQR